MKKIVCRIFLFDRQLLFNLLVYDYRTHSSNIPSGRRSESNPIAQWVIVDKVVQFRLLRHGHIQCILNPGTVNGNFSPIPEQQFYAAGVHVTRCYYERGIVG